MRWLIAALVVIGCRASSQDSQLNNIIQKELGNHFSVELNNSKSFALAWKQEEANVSYVIVQLSTQKVILKKVNIRATVTWHDDLHIKEITKPGVIKKDQTSANGIKLINVNDYLVNTK